MAVEKVHPVGLILSIGKSYSFFKLSSSTEWIACTTLIRCWYRRMPESTLERAFSFYLMPCHRFNGRWNDG